MQEEVYNRSMRSLLNKLSVDNFEVISEELIMWGNKSAKETDGRIVRHLIMLVFDKATDEPVWAPMYARLCYKLICRISPEVEDHSLLTKDDKYLSGGFLVRKYLLSKCQEEFEGGWKVDMPKDLESAEYYEAMKIKRRGLGLIRFIGELFLLEVLTSRIIQECIKRLLTNYENPEEEVTESLCGLLTTVGKKIDQPVAKNLLDLTFSRIKTMSENKQLSSRIRFMLLDLIELRQKGW
ncbi:armadillo-type protein, partial [Coemansia spiralis]